MGVQPFLAKGHTVTEGYFKDCTCESHKRST